MGAWHWALFFAKKIIFFFKNIAVAVENWKNFLNMMIALIDDITRLTGLTKDDLFKKFSIASP